MKYNDCKKTLENSNMKVDNLVIELKTLTENKKVKVDTNKIKQIVIKERGFEEILNVEINKIKGVDQSLKMFFTNALVKSLETLIKYIKDGKEYRTFIGKDKNSIIFKLQETMFDYHNDELCPTKAHKTYLESFHKCMETMKIYNEFKMNLDDKLSEIHFMYKLTNKINIVSKFILGATSSKNISVMYQLSNLLDGLNDYTTLSKRMNINIKFKNGILTFQNGNVKIKDKVFIGSRVLKHSMSTERYSPYGSISSLYKIIDEFRQYYGIVNGEYLYSLDVLKTYMDQCAIGKLYENTNTLLIKLGDVWQSFENFKSYIKSEKDQKSVMYAASLSNEISGVLNIGIHNFDIKSMEDVLIIQSKEGLLRKSRSKEAIKALEKLRFKIGNMNITKLISIHGKENLKYSELIDLTKIDFNNSNLYIKRVTSLCNEFIDNIEYVEVKKFDDGGLELILNHIIK